MSEEAQVKRKETEEGKWLRLKAFYFPQRPERPTPFQSSEELMLPQVLSLILKANDIDTIFLSTESKAVML